MSSSTQHQPLAIDTCVHIYTISAAMIGVCLTGVGLLRVVISLKTTDTWADDLLCLDAVIFLFATISAYWALRSRGARRAAAAALGTRCRCSLRHRHGADDRHLPVHHLRDQRLNGIFRRCYP
jgi:hypothetical protein